VLVKYITKVEAKTNIASTREPPFARWF
jgi:hypothetical protein